MNLRVKINLIVGVLMLMFVAAVLGLQVRSLKESVAEEVVAANRVASQLLNRTLWLYAAQGLPAMRAFLQGMGRVRANDIELFDEAGRRQTPRRRRRTSLAARRPTGLSDWWHRRPRSRPSISPEASWSCAAMPRAQCSMLGTTSCIWRSSEWPCWRRRTSWCSGWLSTVRPFSQIVRALNDLQGGRFDVALPALPGTEAAAIGAALAIRN